MLRFCIKMGKTGKITRSKKTKLERIFEDYIYDDIEKLVNKQKRLYAKIVYMHNHIYTEHWGEGCFEGCFYYPNETSRTLKKLKNMGKKYTDIVNEIETLTKKQIY